MRRLFFAFLIFGTAWLFPFRVPAQSPDSPDSGSRNPAPYLLPQTIFVGDSGRLVVPLGAPYTEAKPFVLEGPGKLPEAPDLEFRRLELEQQGGGARLLIDFVPYAPGLLKFPPLDLSSLAGDASGETALPLLTDLEVTIASILNPEEMALSEPATPMAVPGTSLLVYGTLALVLFLLLLGIGGSIWGRRHFRTMWERFRRRHLLRGMTRFLQRVRSKCNTDKDIDSGHYLSLLSGEFREFLSLFTGVNCRPLTAPEFLQLPLDGTGQDNANGDDAGPDTIMDTDGGVSAPAVVAHNKTDEPAVPEDDVSDSTGPVFLSRLFHSWDTLRFSGRPIDRVDLFLAIKQTEDFLIALDKAEREKPPQKTAAKNREKLS